MRLFIRDYCSEFGIAWSLARMRDCDRNGGHRWGPATKDETFGLSRICGRCGTLETLHETRGTATTTVYTNQTDATR